MLELVQELQVMVENLLHKLQQMESYIDASACRAYQQHICEEEKISTIHSNRWALGWDELSEAQKDVWRDKVGSI